MKLRVKPLHNKASFSFMKIFSYQFTLDNEVTSLTNIEIEDVSIVHRKRVFEISMENDIRFCYAKKTLYLTLGNLPFTKYSDTCHCNLTFRYRLKGTNKWFRYHETIKYESSIPIEKKKKQYQKGGKRK